MRGVGVRRASGSVRISSLTEESGLEAVEEV